MFHKSHRDQQLERLLKGLTGNHKRQIKNVAKHHPELDAAGCFYEAGLPQLLPLDVQFAVAEKRSRLMHRSCSPCKQSKGRIYHA